MPSNLTELFHRLVLLQSYCSMKAMFLPTAIQKRVGLHWIVSHVEIQTQINSPIVFIGD
jgi:hypothetical protein